MGGGVLEHFNLVVAFTDDYAIFHDNATDWDFLLVKSLFRLTERHAHEFFVVVRVIHVDVIRGLWFM